MNDPADNFSRKNRQEAAKLAKEFVDRHWEPFPLPVGVGQEAIDQVDRMIRGSGKSVQAASKPLESTKIFPVNRHAEVMDDLVLRYPANENSTAISAANYSEMLERHRNPIALGGSGGSDCRPVPGRIVLDCEQHGYGDAVTTAWISEGCKPEYHPSGSPPIWTLVHRCRENYIKAALRVGQADQEIHDHNVQIEPLTNGRHRISIKFVFFLDKQQTSPAVIGMEGEVSADNRTSWGKVVYSASGISKALSFQGHRPIRLGIPATATPPNVLGEWRIKFFAGDHGTLPHFNESSLLLTPAYGKASFMRMLGQEVDLETPAEFCITTFAAYQKDELEQQCGRVPRVLSRARSIGIYSTPRRPSPIVIPQEAHNWADQIVADYPKYHSGSQKLILIYPKTHYTSREWPPTYWNELAWTLSRDPYNFAVIVMLDDKDERHVNTPRYVWGATWEHSAALMQRAHLVIGNDSGPANFAGTLGIPTLALMGPTRPEIFAHMPNVRTLAVGEDVLPCIGCHFQKPYRSACDLGCRGLFELKPEAVLRHVLEIV